MKKLIPLNIAIAGYADPKLIERFVRYRKHASIIVPKNARKTRICNKEASKIIIFIKTSWIEKKLMPNRINRMPNLSFPILKILNNR